MVHFLTRVHKRTERLMTHWTTPIYAFFKAIPIISLDDGCRIHTFECNAKDCRARGNNGRRVRRNLTTADATSTSNLRRHAKICWGVETVTAACNCTSVHTARTVLAKLGPKDRSITAAFERVAKEKITFSNRQHTRAELR